MQGRLQALRKSHGSIAGASGRQAYEPGGERQGKQAVRGELGPDLSVAWTSASGAQSLGVIAEQWGTPGAGQTLGSRGNSSWESWEPRASGLGEEVHQVQEPSVISVTRTRTFLVRY